MKEQMKQYAGFLGLDCVGFASAAPYNQAVGTDYSTAIVVLFPYYAGEFPDANLSRYAFGMDYHVVAKQKLTAIAEKFHLDDYRVHADIGPAVDKLLAVNAGLCFQGRNTLCINDTYGSYFFIGYIVCHLDVAFDTPDTRSCMGCGKCEAACPGGALCGGRLDCEKCLSHITQKKGVLTEDEQRMVAQNGLAFGCDTCQVVCPHNAKAALSPLAEFREHLCTHLYAADLENMSEREFQRVYGRRAFAWRGKKVLVRNLQYIAGLRVE